jgi:hypothetical protein
VRRRSWAWNEKDRWLLRAPRCADGRQLTPELQPERLLESRLLHGSVTRYIVCRKRVTPRIRRIAGSRASRYACASRASRDVAVAGLSNLRRGRTR